MTKDFFRSVVLLAASALFCGCGNPILTIGTGPSNDMAGNVPTDLSVPILDMSDTQDMCHSTAIFSVENGLPARFTTNAMFPSPYNNYPGKDVEGGTWSTLKTAFDACGPGCGMGFDTLFRFTRLADADIAVQLLLIDDFEWKPDSPFACPLLLKPPTNNRQLILEYFPVGRQAYDLQAGFSCCIHDFVSKRTGLVKFAKLSDLHLDGGLPPIDDGENAQLLDSQRMNSDDYNTLKNLTLCPDIYWHDEFWVRNCYLQEMTESGGDAQDFNGQFIWGTSRDLKM